MWNQRNAYYSTKKQGGYDSRFEAGYAQELELRKRAKDIKGFDTHVKIPLVVNGYTVCDYYIDFVISHNDGTREMVECKGFATEVWKLKWKLFLAIYEDDPSIKISLIMQGKKGYKPRLRKTRL